MVSMIVMADSPFINGSMDGTDRGEWSSDPALFGGRRLGQPLLALHQAGDQHGAMVSPEEFRQVAAGSKMKPRVAMMGNATAVAQKAVEAAITGPQDFVGFSIKDYKARRDAAAAIFQEEQVGFSYPHGAFYMMVDISCCGMDQRNSH